MPLKLYHSAPPTEGVDGHIPLEKERDTFAWLDRLEIPYDWTAHEPLMTMEACELVEEVFGFPICKNLFLCNQQKTVYYLLLMPADKPFRTKYLSHELGIARLSFGGEEALSELLNLTPGSVSAMGLIFDKEQKVRLLLDEALLNCEWFGCHPCINTATLRMKTDVFVNRFLPSTGHYPTYVRLLPDDAE
ncbi:MAG: prolyl-tRNA synthetase associated domain-containing protein [Clostridia bacterium]|nr:prolyl-tRNA synthetase associated domain-containing protein [Clostridia bacterium]